jgi:hypothetical protein
MPKCIEPLCNEKGTKVVITYDNQKIYVCEKHFAAWLESGAIPKRALLKVISETLMRYGLSSVIFLSGFSLILYNVYINRNTDALSIPSFTGLVLLVLSWLVFCAALKSAYSKVKEPKALKI